MLDKLREHNIVPSLIPGGCTGELTLLPLSLGSNCSKNKVLDVAVNKPFKGILRDVLDGIMEAMSQVELDALDKATDSAIGKRRVLMTRAVGEAWEQVSPG